MKAKSFLTALALFTLLASPINSSCSATVVTFDDLPLNTGTGSFVPSTYQGLVWSNFGDLNAVLYTSVHGSNGYYNGMVTASNVALNAFGAPAEIDSPTNFNFLTAYLTGAFNSNLNIQVEGLRGGSLVYSQVVVASATSPTLFAFNYLNVDRLTFNAFGGQDAGFPVSQGAGDSHFAMDNLTIEFVPEPSSFLLTAAAALMLWPLLKRKRA